MQIASCTISRKIPDKAYINYLWHIKIPALPLKLSSPLVRQLDFNQDELLDRRDDVGFSLRFVEEVFLRVCFWDVVFLVEAAFEVLFFPVVPFGVNGFLDGDLISSRCISGL